MSNRREAIPHWKIDAGGCGLAIATFVLRATVGLPILISPEVDQLGTLAVAVLLLGLAVTNRRRYHAY